MNMKRTLIHTIIDIRYKINKNIYYSSLITITAIITIWVVLSDDHFFSLQLYLSTRRGAWVLNRVGDNGLPLDMVFNRFIYFLQAILPFSFICRLAEQQLNQRFDHALYNLKPKHRYVFLGYFTVSYWFSTTWPIELFTCSDCAARGGPQITRVGLCWSQITAKCVWQLQHNRN